MFEIQLSETLVSFSEQTIENLFNGQKPPESGLFLRKILIKLEEQCSSSLEYSKRLTVNFECNHSKFNGSVSLSKLRFNDERKKTSEQIMGVGYDIIFKNEVKYTEAKDVIVQISKLLDALQD